MTLNLEHITQVLALQQGLRLAIAVDRGQVMTLQQHIDIISCKKEGRHG
jgi:hypothetical protein